MPMKMVIDKIMVVGKSIQNGVQMVDVDPSTVPSAEQQKMLIQKAASSLINIDSNEQDRRKQIGTIGAGLTTLLYGALLYFRVPIGARTLALYMPVALSYGFKKSGDEGL